MTCRVRFSEDAAADLDRLYGFLLDQDVDNWSVAERALQSIIALALLEFSPFSCRKITADNSFLRELVIGFGSSGYVALFEIKDARTVTILAVRLQREDDYY